MIMLSTRASIFLCALLLVYALGRTFASEQTATFTQVDGEVTLFSHPSKTLPTAVEKKTLKFQMPLHP
ncbi:MAG: hypothetical protein HYX41_00470 [Bdellovibrio sp.]|nr:hypothetical protein [Bdellovibrio sp.]